MNKYRLARLHSIVTMEALRIGRKMSKAENEMEKTIIRMDIEEVRVIADAVRKMYIEKSKSTAEPTRPEDKGKTTEKTHTDKKDGK